MVFSEIKKKIKEVLKKHWNVLAAFLAGIFIVLFSFRKKNNSLKQTLARHKKEREYSSLEKEARQEIESTYQENIKDFFENQEMIQEEFQQEISEIEKAKESRVEELMNSSNPNQEIANALSKILNK
jgi:uncharacterized Zn finger protein